MGKKEDKKRLQKVIEKMLFRKSHLHDRSCELDIFLEKNNLDFELEVVGYRDNIYYISYISKDGNNFRLLINEKNNKILLTYQSIFVHFIVQDSM